jgi:hypothetical protein
MQPAESHAISRWKRAAWILGNYQGLCPGEFLRLLPARFRPTYTKILPRNCFTLKKSPPAPQTMSLAAMQDSNRTLVNIFNIFLKKGQL